jgi:hypothetical protein
MVSYPPVTYAIHPSDLCSQFGLSEVNAYIELVKGSISNTPSSGTSSEDNSQIHPGTSALDFPSGDVQFQTQPEDLQTLSKRPENRVVAWKSLRHVYVR